MCCRYYMEESPELRPFVEMSKTSPLTYKLIAGLGRPLHTSGEIRPTDMVPSAAPDRNGKSTVFPMVWGFSGPTSAIFNARCETAVKKPLFRDAWMRHRCIVPASYYFEWQHLRGTNGKTGTGSRYIIQPRGSAVTFFAGLYRIEEHRSLQVPHFTILTREPSDALRSIHDRMPVILDGTAAAEWIDLTTEPYRLREITARSMIDMVCEKG